VNVLQNRFSKQGLLAQINSNKGIRLLELLEIPLIKI
jgi:hypothetical protein